MTDSLGEGLICETYLSLRWHARSVAELPMADARQSEANAEFLRILAVLEERRSEHAEDSTEPVHEFRRLESKLDLVLGMVGKILARQLDLPAPVPVRLGAASIEWQGSPAPALGEPVCIELYLLPDHPCPLFLDGVVESVRTAPEGSSWVRVRFDPLSEAVRDGLERIIFRHHRRFIAKSRRPAS